MVLDIFWKFVKNLKTSLMMHKIDSKKIPKNKSEIRLFMIVKNEALFLPYIFKYYSKLGVDRFFIIDNCSTDKTIPFLLSQKNTHVFRVKGSYGEANCGNDWLMHILKKYGKGNWCVVVDADEILIYPYYEKISLKQLCTYLDFEKATALGTLFLDMYSNKPVRLAKYKKGANPLSICPYFDKDSHYYVPGDAMSMSHYFKKNSPYIKEYLEKKYYENFGYKGGVRKRVFNVEPNLNKFPLFKFKTGMYIIPGQHYITEADFSNIKGATLHFKHMSKFASKALQEATKKKSIKRTAGRLWLFENKKYAESAAENPNLSLYYKNSAKFKNSKQLVKLKIMETSKEFEKYVKHQD